MAKLARHLQESFAEACPTGWDADVEVPLFDGPLRRRLGFQAHCDVRFHQPSSGRSIWVELEISRADPVANHIKFAVGHVEGRLDRDDTFVSMCSNHITPGRRSLAAHAIGLMRRIGMRAVQADLLPDIDGPEIKRLNHLEPDALRCLDLPVDRELDRIFAVAIPRPVPGQGKLMLAPGRAAVQLNIRRWNEDMAVPALREAWGKRTISYFVHDVTAGLFAPSKFPPTRFCPRGSCSPGRSQSRTMWRSGTITRNSMGTWRGGTWRGIWYFDAVHQPIWQMRGDGLSRASWNDMLIVLAFIPGGRSCCGRSLGKGEPVSIRYIRPVPVRSQPSDPPAPGGSKSRPRRRGPRGRRPAGGRGGGPAPDRHRYRRWSCGR